MHTKILNTLLVKPAGPDCNLACDYCFYLGKASALAPAAGEQVRRRMSLPVLETMTRQALSTASPQVSFTWQGGEPTLMGVKFFEQALRFQQAYGAGKAIENSLQTNGLLIDKEWAAFLRQRNLLVGLSLDGPEHVHDRYRKHRDGSGSWQTVLDRAGLLLDQGVQVNALIVVNDYSVQFAQEIYEFHKALGLTWMQFIPCVEPDPADPAKASGASVSGPEYGRFLMRLFDLWWDDLEGTSPVTQIRLFDASLHPYLGLPSSLCLFRPTCGDYLVVEHNGDVYPCDFFVEPRWRLGNLLEHDLLTILNSPAQEGFGQDKGERAESCQTCEWLPLCWGGCPKDWRVEPNRNRTYLCEGYKMFFPYAHERLEVLAARVRAADTTGSRPSSTHRTR